MSALGVFEALAKFDSAMQRARKVAELGRDIRAIGTRCGDCAKWMCRGSCPRERGMMVGGPSSGGAICDSFAESSSATNWREQLISELARVTDPKDTPA